MPRETDYAAVERAQQVLDSGGSQGDAARAAGLKDPRTIRIWLVKGLLRNPDLNAVEEDHSAMELEPREEELEDPSGGSSRQSTPVPSSTRPPTRSVRPRESHGPRSDAFRDAVEVVRAKADETEARLHLARSEADLERFQNQRQAEATRKARDEDRRRQQERADAAASIERQRAQAEEEARRREAAEAERRARVWRREEFPRLMTRHVPADAQPDERAAVALALQDLLAEAGPEDAPSEAAVLAVLVAPLLPYHRRQEARRLEEEEARRRRKDADEAAAAARARESAARIALTREMPYGATQDEKCAAETLLEQRLHEDVTRRPLELVSAIVAPIRAAVQSRADAARLAQIKSEQERREADEKRQARERWEESSERRFELLFDKARDEELAILDEQERESGDLDAAEEKFKSAIRYLSVYSLHPAFKACLQKLKTGADVDAAAGKVIEAHFEELWQEADESARRWGTT